jgi:hypothetical protein
MCRRGRNALTSQEEETKEEVAGYNGNSPLFGYVLRMVGNNVEAAKLIAHKIATRL